MKKVTLILIATVSLSMSACRINKSLLSSSAENNNFLKQQSLLVKSKIDKEFDQGNIEPIIANAFKTSYEAIETKSKERDEIIANTLPKMGAKKAKSLLDSLNAAIDKDKTSLEILLKSISIDTYYEFPSNAFFGPGKYEITFEKEPELKSIFSPALDSIAKFANQYPNNKLQLMLVTYGYADGQGFREGSPLHEFLTKQVGKDSASREELNLKLSELRAIEVANFIDVFANTQKSKFENFSNLEKIKNGIGKGEEFPKKNIDYSEDDERRRIVKFFWKILPKN